MVKKLIRYIAILLGILLLLVLSGMIVVDRDYVAVSLPDSLVQLSDMHFIPILYHGIEIAASRVSIEANLGRAPYWEPYAVGDDKYIYDYYLSRRALQAPYIMLTLVYRYDKVSEIWALDFFALSKVPSIILDRLIDNE